MEFNEKLQELRKQKGIAQEELAEQIICVPYHCFKMGIGKWILYYYLRGLSIV